MTDEDLNAQVKPNHIEALYKALGFRYRFEYGDTVVTATDREYLDYNTMTMKQAFIGRDWLLHILMRWPNRESQYSDGVPDMTVLQFFGDPARLEEDAFVAMMVNG